MKKYSSYPPLRMFQAIWYGDKREYLRLYNDCYRDEINGNKASNWNHRNLNPINES